MDAWMGRIVDNRGRAAFLSSMLVWQGGVIHTINMSLTHLDRLPASLSLLINVGLVVRVVVTQVNSRPNRAQTPSSALLPLAERARLGEHSSLERLVADIFMCGPVLPY